MGREEDLTFFGGFWATYGIFGKKLELGREICERKLKRNIAQNTSNQRLAGSNSISDGMLDDIFFKEYTSLQHVVIQLTTGEGEEHQDVEEAELANIENHSAQYHLK